tara:strand:- start:311 stop:1570 length:1260 start_codon:yes stop_codon:yes gene_type:complete
MFYFKLTVGCVLAVVAWIGIVFFSAFYGFWMQPVVSPGNPVQFFEYASNRLEMENPGNSTLTLIENGQITHQYFSASLDEVNSETVFSTASMSKWITALGVMKLVEAGRLDLDAPVSQYLTRWELPPSEFDNNQVTVRRLLSHTAGFSDGLGFGDYAVDEELPDLEVSLSNPRASSARDVSIAVSNTPGSEWRYSGGSYLLLELVVEEVTGQPFADYMQEAIFNPLEMSRTGYEFIGSYDNNAGSISRNGEKSPTFKYASKAATAFVTSTADLSKLVLSQIPSSQYESILSDDTIRNMREPHGRTSGFDIWGLGTILYSPTESGDFVFGHDGANDPAINTTARINPESGDAIIVLVTGHPSLATNIGSQWVLWETGYPDVLDSDTVMASMYLPIVIGIILILLLSLYFGYRHTSKSRAT